MRKFKSLVAMATLLLSTAVFAHDKIDPVAGTFENLFAGNGGLAWFVLYFGGLPF